MTYLATQEVKIPGFRQTDWDKGVKIDNNKLIAVVLHYTNGGGGLPYSPEGLREVMANDVSAFLGIDAEDRDELADLLYNVNIIPTVTTLDMDGAGLTCGDVSLLPYDPIGANMLAIVMKRRDLRCSWHTIDGSLHKLDMYDIMSSFFKYRGPTLLKRNITSIDCVANGRDNRVTGYETSALDFGELFMAFQEDLRDSLVGTTI